MPRPRPLGADDAAALRAAATQFGAGAAARKADLLAAARGRDLVDPDVLLAWHDALLFLLAYPETPALHRAAKAELRRAAGFARRIAERGPARERRRLDGTGLAWTQTTVAFGWDVARRAARRFPRFADLDSFGEDGIPLAEALAPSLPPLELARAAAAEDGLALLDLLRGRSSRLACLVAQLERLPCDDAVRSVLFDALKPFVALRPRGSVLSRTFVRGLPSPLFCHRDGLARAVDLPALLRTPLPRRRRLSAATREAAIDAACAMLASLGRETDAIALAYPRGVEWHDVGRGIAVALYAMRADRRDVLDSHVGMMLFKNGVPVGYGGGWPFAGTCRIGVNVFPAFRGGESALLFGQVLRVYRQRFGVARFVVEPTQFGGDNLEGLRSGAFWFYWRLGFRPVDADAAARAAAAHARMRSDPGHRPSIAALRRFTDSDLELVVARSAAPTPEPADLCAAAAAWIDARHRGDRGAAEAAAIRSVSAALGVRRATARWSDDERRALRGLAPLLTQIPDLSRWPADDRRRTVALIRAKGGDEFRFQRRLLAHRRLRAALAAIAARGA